MKKQIKQKKCGTKCELHGFCLKPIQDQVFYKKITTANFCKQKKQNSAQYVYPQFNRDNLYYTPAFILGVDKVIKKQFSCITNRMIQKQRNNMNKRLENRPNPLKLLYKNQFTKYEPKPGRKYKYCAVCRINYEDYLQHTRSGAHKKTISLSKYNSFILNTCKQLFGNQQKQKEINSLQIVHQNKKIEEICIDDDGQDFEPPIVKKIKPQEPQKLSEGSTKTNTTGSLPMQNQFYYWNLFNNHNFFNGYQSGINQKPTNCNNAGYFYQPYSNNPDQSFYLNHYQYQYEFQKYQEALSRYHSLPGIMMDRPIVIEQDD